LAIAQKSITEAHVPHLQQLKQDMENASGPAKKEKAKELMDYLLSIDPWTKDMSKVLMDTNSARNITAERMTTVVYQIDQRAQKLGAPLAEEDKTAMEVALKFWRSRVAASKTMTDNAGRIADRQGVKIVALNIGAAHTEGITTMLSRSGRPFVVFRPKS